jgi:hypothetical protein
MPVRFVAQEMRQNGGIDRVPVGEGSMWPAPSMVCSRLAGRISASSSAMRRVGRGERVPERISVGTAIRP